MNAREIMDYYSRKDIQDFLIRFSRGREIAGVFRSGSFGKRPNTLVYPQDILSQVRSGIMEFHSSLELWENPIALKERKGFDLVLDLDCSFSEHGRIAAEVLSSALEKHGVRSYSIKFSGNRGFHLGIPWSSIPREIDFKPTASLFPDIARKVGLYIRDFMKEKLEKALLKSNSAETLAEQAQVPLEKILTPDGINPFRVVDIDPVLISPRHLFRMPYSLNKKTFLVSLPLEKNELGDFEKESARPEKIKKIIPFLEAGEEGEAELLFAEGIDWATKNTEKEKPLKKRQELKAKVPEKLFPPCIKNIQLGLMDGKKRSVFILINFLHSLKWSWEEIDVFLKEWNKKNQPPLAEQYLTTQIRYYLRKKPFPPPNCYQEGWYTGFSVCNPDQVCRSREDIKNPVNYPFRLMRKKGFARTSRKRAFRPGKESPGKSQI